MVYAVCKKSNVFFLFPLVFSLFVGFQRVCWFFTGVSLASSPRYLVASSPCDSSPLTSSCKLPGSLIHYISLCSWLCLWFICNCHPSLIADTSPPHIREKLATIPQLNNSGGTFFGYCMGFLLSLENATSWRFIAASLMVPSISYVALCLFYIPESPRWLVSKGRMIAAKKVLQNLLNKENVSGKV